MFSGKVVWITGASSGIGKAFAQALHAQGAQLIVSALTEEELQSVVQELPGAKPLAFDVADFDTLPRMVEHAIGFYGRIDVLINNAGITQRALAKDTAFSVYRRLIDIDLLAPIALTQLVMPHFRAQGSGRVIAIASIAGKMGASFRTAYSAAKHGVFGYFDALRAEVEMEGIEINVVAPGSVRTNLARNAMTGDGGTFGKTDEFIEGGYAPEYLIDQVLKAIKKGKREIVIARGREKLGYLLRRFFPETAFDKIAASTPEFIQQLNLKS